MKLTLTRFLKRRRYIEAVFWLILFLLIVVSQWQVGVLDVRRQNLGFDSWEILTWEASSNLSLLLLIPIILVFDKHFPLRWRQLKSSLPAHIVFSVVISILHVTMMVAMRKAVYWLAGGNYEFGNVVREFFYEYLKDSRSYATILVLIYLYRHMLFRLQGEASLLSKPDPDINTESESYPERMLVKKLGREFLIRLKDVERIEAAGNYVNLHIAKRIYPLRETMANIEKKLDGGIFKRVHRSHIVNLDHVREIVPLETGDAQVLLESGSKIPMSRTYKSGFLENAASS